MTTQEFNDTNWSFGMTAMYKGVEYTVGSCDFEENLVGMVDNNDDIFWVRCENIKVIS